MKTTVQLTLYRLLIAVNVFTIFYLNVCTLHGALTGDEGMTLLLHLDELGLRPIAVDATANNLDGATVGYVAGGAQSINNTAYKGFTSQNSCIRIPVVTGTAQYSSRDWSFSAWVCNPDFTSPNPVRTIARGTGGTSDGSGANVPWQVWVDNEGFVHLGVQNWNGGTFKTNSTVALEWEPDVWYHVAVVQKYTYFSSNDTRNENFKIYVTPYNAESVGSPVIDADYLDRPGLASGTQLVIGGGRQGWGGSVRSPAGYWGGEIDEVSFWLDQALSETQLNMIFKAFTPSSLPLDSYASLLWRMDEKGLNPIAVDSTENGLDGESRGNVRGGYPSMQGTAYLGFTSMQSLVGVTNVVPSFASRDWSFTAYIRNPVIAEGHFCLIARGAGNVAGRYGASGDIPWQLWIDEDGALNIGVAAWNNTFDTTKSDPLDWEWGQWYQVAVLQDFKKTNSPETFYSRFTVYVTPAESNASIGDPVIDWTFISGGGLANSTALSVGGGKNGYHHGSHDGAKGGWFGGQIDEVSFYDNVLIKKDQLDKDLKRFNPVGALILIR
jgi:hypothetical protein